MNVRHVYQWCVVGTLLALGLAFGLQQSGIRTAANTRAAGSRRIAEQGVQVLARGPVHEAFAGNRDLQSRAGARGAKDAPAAIEEVPPTQRPAGTNVAWNSGYWSWDDERNDFFGSVVSGAPCALAVASGCQGNWGKSAQRRSMDFRLLADAKGDRG